MDLGKLHLPGVNSYLIFLKSLKMAALYRRHEIFRAKSTFTFLSVITVLTKRSAMHKLSAV